MLKTRFCAVALLFLLGDSALIIPVAAQSLPETAPSTAAPSTPLAPSMPSMPSAAAIQDIAAQLRPSLVRLRSSESSAERVEPGTGVVPFRRRRSRRVASRPFASAQGRAPQGDAVTLLGRRGKAGGRLPSVENVRLLAVMTRPHTLYILPIAYLSRLGEVAFNGAGRLSKKVKGRSEPVRV